MIRRDEALLSITYLILQIFCKYYSFLLIVHSFKHTPSPTHTHSHNPTRNRCLSAGLISGVISGVISGIRRDCRPAGIPQPAAERALISRTSDTAQLAWNQLGILRVIHGVIWPQLVIFNLKYSNPLTESH